MSSSVAGTSQRLVELAQRRVLAATRFKVGTLRRGTAAAKTVASLNGHWKVRMVTDSAAVKGDRHEHER